MAETGKATRILMLSRTTFALSLRNASLTNASLRNASLRNASLRNASLRNASLGNTSLLRSRGLNLSPEEATSSALYRCSSTTEVCGSTAGVPEYTALCD
jgi:uncharacterized protein YjbI with pentapeptide repeats